MPIVLIPLLTVLVNDFLKVVYNFFKTWKFKLSLMFKSWWMPSWHTSFVSSALTVVFLELWPWSIEFMITLVFAVIVMYDARWIRRKAWEQAWIINILQKKIIESTKKDHLEFEKLDEILWHSNLEVALWFVFWALFSFCLWKTWFFLIS